MLIDVSTVSAICSGVAAPPPPAALADRGSKTPAARSSFRTRTVEPIDFRFGFGDQSLFVSGHASKGTELHVPITMNTGAELSATVIAAQHSWGCAQTVASAAHHNTYTEQI